MSGGWAQNGIGVFILMIYIAGNPDGSSAQDQGYVVALGADAEWFVVAH